MPQQNFTTASAPVMMLYIGGAIAQFLSVMPDATAFRYTAVRFTTFGQAWYFENFSKGATSYLGESLTYEATRNKDIHEATYVRYELPGIGNVQTWGDLAPVARGAGESASDFTPWGATAPAAQIYEVLHDDICPKYQEAVSTKQTYNEFRLVPVVAISWGDTVGANPSEMVSLSNQYYKETNSSCVAESYFTTSDTTNFKRKGEGQPYYTDGVAIAAIKSVDFEIGGQRMDRHDKYAIYTWLMLNSGSIGVPLDMCGLATTTTQRNLELKRASMAFQVKYCPLIFSFCRAPSMGVPLISNMYNNLTLRIEFEPFSALICNYSGTGLNGAQGTTAVKPSVILTPDGTGTHDGRAYPSAPARNFGGASIGIVAASTQFYTRVRKNEDTLANSYARTIDLQPGNNFIGITASTSATVLSSNLTQEHFGVSIVSKAYFLGPEERTAFASNAFNQIVECCQRIMLSTTQSASQAYRIDQFQNAASSMYVCPIYKPNLANNQYFTHGGAYDHVRDQTWPAVNTVELSTNGAVLYQAADESFYRQVQPFAHHSNVLPPWRRVYALNFGIRANAMFKPVQANGYLNWSRTANAMLTLTHPDNLWATASNAALHVTPTASTLLQILVVVWNYNVLQYRGGIAGYKYTQGNNSA